VHSAPQKSHFKVIRLRPAISGADVSTVGYAARVPRPDLPRRGPHRRAPGAAAPPRRGPAEPLADLLPRLLDEVGLGQTAQAVAVIRAWDEAIGPLFRAHCRPDGVKNGVLHARVRDSAWMQRVQLEKPRIFARLRERLGESAPRELRLRIGAID
jgi:predicted nucleic acid-binding Zn ribbon protein